MIKRSLVGLAVLGASLVPLAGHAAPNPEGCVVVAGQGPATADITDAGAGNAIIAGGTWSVDIERDGRTLHYGDVHGVPQVLPDVLQAGDHITCSADQGAVIAGRI